MTNFLNLSWVQFTESLVIAVVSIVVTYLVGVVEAPGFSVYTFHWSTLATVAFIAFVSALATKLGTTNQGKFLGAVKVN
jgi:hypothetical protein